MEHTSDFIIEDGYLHQYVGNGGDIVIPDGVRVVQAFESCETIRSVVVPEEIGRAHV